ncbi:MAG: helix-turn-helix domain-containing protein [Eubacteriales bacterium]
MKIGDKIFRLRQKNGWSQDELAEKLSVSRQSVSKWESGRVLPDSDKIILLSELFSVTADFLLKDSEESIQDLMNDSGSTAAAIMPAKVINIETVYNADDININIEEDETALATGANTIPKKKLPKKIVALIVAACILAAAIIPYPLGLYGKVFDLITEDTVQYPYILVHGLGGWGAESGINETAPYWGATTGSLSKYLVQQGYSVYEASVGPFSSTWDRACELYAQLTGTKVDYGEAHSNANGHLRYGRTYTKPLFEGWGTKTEKGQLKKINLVGHSFGGPTIRLLVSLLANGAKEEIEKSEDSVSPLFKGGKGDWVNSITALDSPNNGSSLFLILDKYKLTSLLFDVCLAFAGVAGNSPVNGYLDFHLEQFGISSVPGEITSVGAMKDSLNKALSTGNDNSAYDLSPDGCAELNKRIQIVDGVYYFSYSYCTTKKRLLGNTQVPEINTLAILMPTAYLMGKFSVNTDSNFKIDKTWLPNDGLVNVVSAKYPFDEAWQDFDAENIMSGIWNVMPTRNGDHGTVIGLNANTEVTHTFYTDLFKMIDSIPREKKYYYKSPFLRV